MLTDEELTTRLRAAFDEGVPELEYAGTIPRVHHRGGLAATSVLAGAVALALAPAALQRTDDRHPTTPTASPSRGTAEHGRTVRHTLDLGSLHLTYATTAGQSGLLFMVGPEGIPVPADAEKVDLGIPAQVWFAAHPGDHDPQVYVQPEGSSSTFGLLAPGWTRQQFIDLLEHADQRRGRS